METHIRLAERQGLLRGYGISPVQFTALTILELLDYIAKVDNEDRELRLALVAAGVVDPEDAFSQLRRDIIDDSEPLAEEADADGNAIPIKYDFSNAVYDPKAVEEEIKQMLARAAQGQTGFDMPYDDWEG